MSQNLLPTIGLMAAAFTRAAAWSCNDEGATETLKKVGLASVDDKAVCNDGTEAAYYIKDNGNPHLWVVYLAGGGWCFDKVSCQERYNGTEYPHHDCSSSSEAAPCFMSSKDYPETCGKTGIFDTSSNSPLRTANKVYVPYCSSDGHMGDGEFAGWQFRGARIGRAVIAALKKKSSLGTAGSTLIFGGGSAGGRGAMVLLDEVAKMLPEMTLLGFLDSPYLMDVPSDSVNFNGFQEQHVGVLENFNGSSIVSSDCAAAYKTEPWKCLFGQYRMPFLTTPYLMAAAQFDGWQLSHLVHDCSGIEKDPVYTSEQAKYVEDFGAKTRALAQTLPSGKTPWAIVYSTACYNHHISEHTSFWTVATSRGTSESDAMKLLLQRKGGQLIDSCSGFNCGSGCGALLI
jgi:hypothetical protein